MNSNNQTRKRIEKTLGDYQTRIEELVTERTAALSEVVRGLQAEIAECQRVEYSLNKVLESMGEGLIVLDPDFRIVRANKAFARQVGQKEDDIIGRKCTEISGTNCKSGEEVSDRCPARYTFATGEPGFAHLESRDGKSLELVLEVKSYPVREHDGRIGAVIEIINDVTERQHMEEQLRQAQKMEALGALAGGIAHDFNNILVPILGYAELLVQEAPLGSQMLDDLQILHRAALRAKSLVRQILTYSRQSKQERVPLELGQAILEGVNLLKSSLPANVKLEKTIAADGDRVLADPTEVHQVVMNLCTNACQVMQNDGGVLTIRLDSVEVGENGWPGLATLLAGPYARLSVSDTGGGMDKKTMARIFDPYFTTKKKGEGTGLGLAIVHAILNSYGGGIAVDSTPGKGTTFELFFPSLASEAPTAEQQTGNGLPTGTERILIVDDEQAVLEFLKRGLEIIGYKVRGVSSSAEALGLFMADPDGFDLVITDQTMPKMTGSQLAVKIREIRPAIPVILCTGFSSVVDENKAATLGIKRFLFKPVGLKDLAVAVRQVLDGR